MAERQGQSTSFSVTVAREGLSSAGQPRVGLWSSLNFDSSGQPIIAHVDANRANVLVTRRDQSGCWKTNEIFSTGAYVYPTLGRVGTEEALTIAVKVGFDATHRSAHTLMANRILLPRCQ